MEKLIETLVLKLPFLGGPVKLFLATLAMVVLEVIYNEVVLGEKMGAEKKAAVVASINKQINVPGGLEWPTFIPEGYRAVAIDKLIELVVFAGNKFGFLGK